MTNGSEVIERWKQHFDGHLNGAEAEHQDDRGDDFIGVAHEEDEPIPTVREVKDVICKLKNIKTVGKDGIGAILIKMGPDKLMVCLRRLIIKIWDTELLPEE